MKFCPECGFKLDKVYKFCPECGYKLAGVAIDENKEFEFSDDELNLAFDEQLSRKDKKSLEDTQEREKRRINGLEYYKAEKYASAFPLLLEFANEDGECAYYIAECFKNGFGTNKNQNKADRCYKKSAELGYDKAIEILKTSVIYNSKSLAKLKNEALDLFYNKKYEEAFPLLLKVGISNDAEIAYAIGYCYYNGKGIKQEDDKGIFYFTLSANQGYANAQYELGCAYCNGLGVEKNLKKAISWYEKAVIQENAYAQCALGVCYENGLGVEKNPKLAFELYERAANQGYAAAQNHLAICYDKGIGVNREISKAMYWFTRAANQNDADAQYNLADYYFTGRIITDYKNAFIWYEKAAILNHAAAQYSLGYMYENGKGTTKDLAKAKYWYERSAAQGNEKALEKLK